MDKNSLYEKYEETIEEIAELNKNKTFAFLSEEDIKQEIRIICFNALEKFDESKSSARTYLWRCVTNRLNNLKRDKYFRLEKPCLKTKCPMYNVFQKKCTSNTYPSICPHIKKSEQKIKRQIGVINNASIDGIDFEEECQNIDIVHCKDINKEIKEAIIEASGQKYGIKYDIFIKYGIDHIQPDEKDYFRGVAGKVIYGDYKGD